MVWLISHASLALERIRTPIVVLHRQKSWFDRTSRMQLLLVRTEMWKCYKILAPNQCLYLLYVVVVLLCSVRESQSQSHPAWRSGVINDSNGGGIKSGQPHRAPTFTSQKWLQPWGFQGFTAQHSTHLEESNLSGQLNNRKRNRKKGRKGIERAHARLSRYGNGILVTQDDAVGI